VRQYARKNVAPDQYKRNYTRSARRLEIDARATPALPRPQNKTVYPKVSC